MGLNNVNGNNKALDLIKSIGIPEEQPQVQEQTEIEEQPQVQEQAQIEESELQETEIDDAEIMELENCPPPPGYQGNKVIIGPQIQKQNPMMQMMQKLLQMMMQLLQMMMGKINDEPPEKPTEQPIFTRIEVNNDMYSIPELN